MAPHTMDTILQPPQWPLTFSSFITWCLMWDPKNRPTSRQALDHEFFADAIDPLRPKSSASRLLGRKQSDLSFKSAKDSHETPPTTSKPSWFRRSLIARDSAPAVPLHDASARSMQKPSAMDLKTSNNARPAANKRATWTNGVLPAGGAPMPILPSIRPISPLPNAVTAEASSRITCPEDMKPKVTTETADEKSKKIGRQLSVNSHGNHYADLHRQEAERSLNGGGPLMSPPYGQKESFFSHLRKRARRLSGRHGFTSPSGDDVEANAGAPQWSNRSSMVVDSILMESSTQNDFTDLDRALQNVRYSLERPRVANDGAQPYPNGPQNIYSNPSILKRQHSTPQVPAALSAENTVSLTPVSARTRRALQMATHPVHQYETPEEEDELLDEVLNSTHRATRRLDHHQQTNEQRQRVALKQKGDNRQTQPFFSHNLATPDSYPTPSPSAKRDGVLFGQQGVTPLQPLPITKKRTENEHLISLWPTPPYEENEWAAAATASIFATASDHQ
jgi:meiosis induction protein kinase IME2/SME1